MVSHLGSSPVFAIAFVIAFTNVANCTHFRGGSMTWRAVEEDNKMKVEIAYKLAYQIDTNEGDNRCSREKVEAQVKVDGDYKEIQVQYPDGTEVASVDDPRTTYYCTERHEAADYPVDVSNSWIIGENKQVVDLPDNLLEFNFLWHSCCWVSMNNYISPKDWDFMMSVNLIPRLDTGAINNPPQTTGIPVKVISRGCEKTYITIPTRDADGDVVLCRWVNPSEGECGVNCGGDSVAPPITWELENNNDGCRLAVTPLESSPGWYGVPIMLEDYIGNSRSPLSRVPFQFMLKIVDGATCPRPEIVSPPLDTCLVLSVGQSREITLTARAVTSGTSIRDIMTSGIIGMHKSDIQPVPGRPGEFFVTLTWTPPESERDRSSTLCFQPEDSDGFQGDMHCVDLYVGASPAPVPDPINSQPSAGHKVHFSQTNFAILFDSRIKRPTTQNEIRILHASDGSLLYSVPVETTSTDEAVTYYPDVILFAIPPGYLLEGRSYTIDLPAGLARGRKGCGVSSQADSWDFSVVGDLPAENKTTTDRIPFQPECYGTYMQIYIPKLIVPYEDPSHVYFREPICVAQLHNATHFVLRTNYQFCGTTIVPQGDSIALATNDIRIVGETIAGSNLATRNAGDLIHLVCRISNDHITFVSLDTDIPVTRETTLEGEATYNYTLVMYEDSSYNRPYGYSTYPIGEPHGERMYFQATATGSLKRRMAIHLRSCIATPSPNPDDRLSFQFIEHGCPLDDTIEFGSVSRSRIQFSIESFAFLQHFMSNSIAVHCEIWVMRSNRIPQCPAKRRRRYADSANMDGLTKATE